MAPYFADVVLDTVAFDVEVGEAELLVVEWAPADGEAEELQAASTSPRARAPATAVAEAT